MTGSKQTTSNSHKRGGTHPYHDFSRYLQESRQTAKPKKADVNFPAKLHDMLSEPQFSHIIVWMPHGRTFKILDRELLMTEAVPEYFVQTKFKSFSRQLTGWGFKRLHQPGADLGCYYHERFLRRLPQLTWSMKRLARNLEKHTPSSTQEECQEPDFDLISRMRPLPNDTVTLGHDDCTNRATVKQEEFTSATIPALPPVPSLQVSDWRHFAQNTMMPLAQEDVSDYNSEATAPTMVPSASVAPIHTREMTGWNHLALDSTALSVARSALPPVQSLQASDWRNFAQNTIMSLAQEDVSDYNSEATAPTMVPSAPVARIHTHETTGWNHLALDSTTALSVARSALPSVPHLPAGDWKNFAHNTMTPLGQEETSDYNSEATAPTMVPSASVARIHTREMTGWNHLALDSTASSAARSTKISSSSSEASTHPTMYPATNVENSRMAPTQMHSPMASTFLNYLSLECQNDVPKRAHLPQSFNRDDSAYHASYPTNCDQISAAVPIHLQHCGGGYNSYSAQDQIQSSERYHQQEKSGILSDDWFESFLENF